jgi:hypothetical protein
MASLSFPTLASVHACNPCAADIAANGNDGSFEDRTDFHSLHASFPNDGSAFALFDSSMARLIIEAEEGVVAIADTKHGPRPSFKKIDTATDR